MSEARYVTTIRLTAAERGRIKASGLSITRFMQAAIERYNAADEVCIHADDPAYGQLVALAAARGQTVTLCGVDPAKLTNQVTQSPPGPSGSGHGAHQC